MSVLLLVTRLGLMPCSAWSKKKTFVNLGGVASAPAGMVSGSGMARPVPARPLNTRTTPVYDMSGPGGPPMTFGSPGMDPLQGSEDPWGNAEQTNL